MASITSVISLFVLLFVAYSYGVPLVQQTTSSTPVQNEKTVNMQLVPDNEWSTVPSMFTTIANTFPTPLTPVNELPGVQSKKAVKGVSESQETTSPCTTACTTPGLHSKKAVKGVSESQETTSPCTTACTTPGMHSKKAVQSSSSSESQETIVPFTTPYTSQGMHSKKAVKGVSESQETTSPCTTACTTPGVHSKKAVKGASESQETTSPCTTACTTPGVHSKKAVQSSSSSESQETPSSFSTTFEPSWVSTSESIALKPRAVSHFTRVNKKTSKKTSSSLAFTPVKGTRLPNGGI